MSLPTKRIVVIGARDVGLTLAAKLQMSGFQTCVVGRGQGRVVRVEGWGKAVSHQVFGLHQGGLSHTNMVIIAVKAYDLLGVINRYVPYFPTGIPIVLACRGAIEDVIKVVKVKHPGFIWRRGVIHFSSRVLNDSYMIFERNEGSCFVMGDVVSQSRGRGIPDLTPMERAVLAATSDFFSWNKDLRPIVRRRWLEDTVMDSLSVVWQVETQGELLTRLDELKEVFHEAYHLAAEHWGAWQTTEEQLYMELISKVTKLAVKPNRMAAELSAGARTESGCLANLSASYRGYPKLKQLHTTIQELEDQYRTLDRKKSAQPS